MPHIQLSRKAPQFQRSISGGMGFGSTAACAVLMVSPPRRFVVGAGGLYPPLWRLARAVAPAQLDFLFEVPITSIPLSLPSGLSVSCVIVQVPCFLSASTKAVPAALG